MTKTIFGKTTFSLQGFPLEGSSSSKERFDGGCRGSRKPPAVCEAEPGATRRLKNVHETIDTLIFDRKFK